MHSQPESRVLIELRLTCFRVTGDLHCKQLPVAFNFRGRCISVDNQLHDPARAENGGWSECQNVFRGAALGFVGFGDCCAAGFELVNVMFENRFGDWYKPGDVVVGRA